MLASVLSALSDRLDFSFLTAFWLPACVAVFGVAGIWTLGVGWSEVGYLLEDIDSLTQGFLSLIILLGITLVAFVLRALSLTIAAMFAGDLLPHQISSWMQAQQIRKHQAQRSADSRKPAATKLSMQRRVEQRTTRTAPHDHEDFRPTRIGNLMAVANEHPRLAYAMNGLFWWPRLKPVAPGDFQATLAGVQAPLMALLNLSLVFLGLAITSVAALFLAHLSLVRTVVILIASLVLANPCYRAAVAQAAQLSTLLCVGFDLYRHEILRIMDLEVPESLEDERKLWISLTSEMLALRTTPPAPPAADSSSDATDVASRGGSCEHMNVE